MSLFLCIFVKDMSCTRGTISTILDLLNQQVSRDQQAQQQRQVTTKHGDSNNGSVSQCVCISSAKINELKENNKNFATALFKHFFALKELSDPNVNVFGKTPNSNIGETKDALNSRHVNEIERIIKEETKGDADDQETAWKSAVSEVNSHLSYLRKSKKN